ncbi:MAG: ABC transporter permease, partial [Actinomycetota bacterium]
STRVINFAVGNMGIPGATLFALMVINYGFPFWIALAAALVMGALIGLVTEVIVVKRLFHRPRVVLLIATVALADFWRAVVVLTFPEVSGEQRIYPMAIGREFTGVGGEFGGVGWAGVAADEGILVRGTDIQTLLVVPVVAVVLGWLLTKTTFGKAISASADNPELSRVSGINPHVVSTVVWTIGGFLATLTMILVSSGRSPGGIGNLGAFTLTNALAAAVIAGLRSFPRAMAGGIAIAFLDNVVGFNFTRDPGLATLIVFIAVIAALYWQSRTESMGEAFTFATKVRPLSPAVRRIWWVRLMPRISMAAVLVAVVLIAWHHETLFDWADRFLWFWDEPPEAIKPSKFFLFSSVVAFAIIVASLTVITGWSGQVSLAQAAYAGIGALTGAAITRGVELDIGFGDTRLIDVELAGLPALPAIVLATLFTAAFAAITGVGALRVNGVKLAISTFALALAAEIYIYRRPFFSDGGDAVVFERGWLFDWHLRDQRTYFFFCLFCLAMTILVIGRLRRSGIGRSIIAVRDNSDTASAYTVSPARMKLTAFAFAGGIAGLGGAILGNGYRQIRFVDAHSCSTTR